jgi:hypothetical protein
MRACSQFANLSDNNNLLKFWQFFTNNLLANFKQFFFLNWQINVEVWQILDSEKTWKRNCAGSNTWIRCCCAREMRMRNGRSNQMKKMSQQLPATHPWILWSSQQQTWVSKLWQCDVDPFWTPIQIPDFKLLQMEKQQIVCSNWYCWCYKTRETYIVEIPKSVFYKTYVHSE